MALRCWLFSLFLSSWTILAPMEDKRLNEASSCRYLLGYMPIIIGDPPVCFVFATHVYHSWMCRDSRSSHFRCSPFNDNDVVGCNARFSQRRRLKENPFSLFLFISYSCLD